ncbi:DUF4362 domain-containing protein [Paenibacillus nasutitermitis]|uniref:DUF4362 domain-containing protein n=1 Tax=Paenibacillus nasutitermitis TaxID=1652958 RepID=A0A916YRI7_9BACL|nr:DUF4362 domain-containing protein [Paenibacillus nasutitermitis]GGD57980.1 hypothetical protein GCM10010911_14730 [Paenibacillus nasutitermitis]
MHKSYCMLFIIVLMLALTACQTSPGGKIKSDYPDLSSREAEKAGYVVAGPAGYFNIDKMEAFYTDYKAGTASTLVIAHYTDEGDPVYAGLDYNGEFVTYSYDNSWDAFGGQDKGVKQTECGTVTKQVGPYGEQEGTLFTLSGCKEDIGYSDPDNKSYFLLFVPGK